MARLPSIRLARRALLAALSIPTVALAAGPAEPPRSAPAAPPTSAAAAPPGANPVQAAECWTAKGQRREPVFSEACSSNPVARVDDSFITTYQLMIALASAHSETAEAKVAHKDLRPTVEKLVDVRVIALEAREEGMDELPAVKEKVGKAEENLLKDILKGQALKGIAADRTQVERTYAEAIQEYRIHSLKFQKKADATLVASRMAGGKAFPEVAKALVKEKKAQDSGEDHVTADKLVPAVKAALERATPGAVLSPVKVYGSWLVAQLIESRKRDDPDRKIYTEVEEANLATQRELRLRAYHDSLSAKHAKVDRKLLASINFDAPKPGVEALMKDKRVLVRLDSGKTITVGGLTDELDKQFFHGVEDAAKQKRANNRKTSTFDSMLFRMLLLDEAERQGLRQTERFKLRAREAADRTLFQAYLESAVAPSIQVSDAECKKYFEEHKADYSTPAVYQLDAIAFADLKDAQAAAAKLKAGTDFKWARANADGAIPAGKEKLKLGGLPVTLDSMPDGLAKTLSGAKEGDYRLFAGDGENYVIRLVKEYPAGTQPFEGVQEAIKKKLFSERVAGSIREWAGKIRKHHQVEIYVGEASR
jgi:parvulin-like peptidyl-prolyl isomerase